jgi:molybdopterin synthase sulfur carrier subunit
MIEIEFTSHLAQQADCPAVQSVAGATLREAFDSIFEQYPDLRDQVLNPDGSVRPHLAVFINGEMLEARDALQTDLRDGSEVFVMQAVSGG